ncbi:UNVERIFIED_CONTAM: putative tRNA pseudouridine synthase Pus10 [Siphonaria sp. JEL0065]|nr:putative tRNA pseudouridine synthase Pus10 [Siphonaria sp. JEL0065]
MGFERLVSPAIISALPSSAGKIVDMLYGHAVCSVCVLRLLGVRKPTLSLSLSKAPQGGSLGSPSGSLSNGSLTKCVCPACLGLLSHSTVSRAVTKAHALFENQQWRGASDFLVAVRVPVQLALRARVFSLLVDEIDPENNNAKVQLRDPKRFDLKKNPILTTPEIINDPLDNEPFSITDSQIEVKEVLRWLIQSEFERVSGIPFATTSELALEIGFDHPQTDSEFDFMQAIPKCNLEVKKKRKRVREGSVWRKMKEDEPGALRVEGATWNHILNASCVLNKEEFAEHKFLPLKLKVDEDCILAEFRFLRHSLWLAGRYNKYDRTVSNSRMEFNGKRLAEESVEELIALHVDAFFKADGHKFASAGREDVDVLMLGAGRPFYLEICGPKVLDASQMEVSEVQREINEAYRGKIKITDLQLVGKHDTKPLKDSAATKKKSYTTLVRLSSPVPLAALEKVSLLRDIELKQQTPLRVMISRPDKNRDKVVHELHVKPENEGILDEASGELKYDLVRVDLTTSAGTYVKEFMHSDEGRTVPSLKELLEVESASVETLDVLHVFLDWPKPIL